MMHMLLSRTISLDPSSPPFSLTPLYQGIMQRSGLDCLGNTWQIHTWYIRYFLLLFSSSTWYILFQELDWNSMLVLARYIYVTSMDMYRTPVEIHPTRLCNRTGTGSMPAPSLSVAPERRRRAQTRGRFFADDSRVIASFYASTPSRC